MTQTCTATSVVYLEIVRATLAVDQATYEVVLATLVVYLAILIDDLEIWAYVRETL